jgi:hypothetical protein
MLLTFDSINCFEPERREPPGGFPSDLRTFNGQPELEMSVRFANVAFFFNF